MRVKSAGMPRALIVAGLLASGAAAGLAAAPAQASVHVGVGVGVPGVFAAPPVVVAPPAVVYPPTVFAPPVVTPPYGYVGLGFGGGFHDGWRRWHGGERHGGWHGHR